VPDAGLCRAAKQLKTIGLISDTHGLLRPEAVRALAGVRHIIHAGDIGGPEILEELRRIAPVHAVRGNNDKGAWAAQIPRYLALELEGVSIHVLHDVKEIDTLRRQHRPLILRGHRPLMDPVAAGCSVVVSGHSHKPTVTERDGVQFVNPGSAGPRRFSLPVTIAYLDITTSSSRPRIVEPRIIEIL
jgi:uncharacterized protein